jgi:transcription elongation factor GreA
MAKAKKITYTQQGYQQLVDELQYLRVEKREKIKNDIAVARSFGDLSENAEYDEARNEQAKNEVRIKELEELIQNAIVIDENETDAEVVGLGSFVKVEKNGAEVEYKIVGSNEADPFENKISDMSPVGKALVGARKGSTVSVITPAGTVNLTILDVYKA